MAERAGRHPRSRLWGTLRLDEIPSVLGLGGLDREGVSAKSVWTPDFVLLSALVTLTVLLGRAFSKVKLPGSPIYVTEVALVGIVGLALWRLRLSGMLARVRRVVPLVPLLLFWLAGAIAAARGLQGFGFRRVLPDVALVEYSIFVPLVAVVADTRERIVRLFAVMFFAAIVTTVGFGFLWHFDINNALFERDPFVAIAMYMAFFVLLVVARLSIRSPVTPVELVLAGAGLVLISVTVVRTAVFALAASLFVMVLLVPRSSRLLAGVIAVGALGLSVGGALLVEKSQQASSVAVTRPPPPPVAVGRRLVAADGGNPLVGGRIVKGDAASGRRARRAALGKALSVELAGLKLGATYTVLFAVKPLLPEVTAGLVGNLTGLSWGQQYWTAAPVPKWQFFRKTLTAQGPTDQLALMAQFGSPRVIFDAVKVLKGRRPGPSGDFPVQGAVASPDFVADDGSSAFAGGVWVRGDAARGRYSRRLGLGQRLNLARLTGLRRGQTYTVSFAVKPLSDEVTTGSVGDPTGLGWGQQYWTAAPVRKWQFFKKTLRATAASEDLGLVTAQGSRAVLFDAVKVLKGRQPGPSGDFSVQRAVARPNFVADDGSSAFAGGVWVGGDAARGRYSRRLGLGQRLNLARLTGLRRGQTYTVSFAVKPLSDEVTTGSVGDPTGLGWDQQYWTAAPVRKWQFFRKTLRATAAAEDLGIVSMKGSPRVLFDAVELRKGTTIPVPPPATKPAAPSPKPPAPKPPAGPSQPAPSATPPKPAPPPPPSLHAVPAQPSEGGGRTKPTPPKPAPPPPPPLHAAPAQPSEGGGRTKPTPPKPAPPPAPPLHAAPAQPSEGGGRTKPTPPPPAAPAPTSAPRSALPLATDLSNTFGGVSGSGSNVSWRFAIWHYMLRKTLHDPVFGVGFGRPTNFRWHGIVYDSRAGNNADLYDVTGPHNSFVNLIFRTGLLGLLSLLALVGIAALRLVRALRSSRLHELERALLVGSAAIFAFVTVTASFSVALEGPYMGMFFWLFLGLLLVLPGLFLPRVTGNLHKVD